ncbi:NAD(P)-dependent oxidoreductase [Paenibacillus yanchengensis]|uniref:precorrin-2 dehydrogenase n=1 Tax=Paenibacillus yanchengensis TaxID=2035833 RepID=A0ABW4YN68_9BACL
MFPVQINPANYSFTVVGGGEIANHKVKNLLRFGIKPLVISPHFHPDLLTLEKDGLIELKQKFAEWSDLIDAHFIILVTNDEQANDRLAKQAVAAGKLVVHAANPALGNAQLPAVLRRGKLQISVATDGASPTLAKQIRDDLAEQYDEKYESYLAFLAEVRQFVKVHVQERSERNKWLKEAATPLYLEQAEARLILWKRLYHRNNVEY